MHFVCLIISDIYFLSIDPDSSSDEAEIFELSRHDWKVRVRGSRANINRGICSWNREYLCPDPIYPPALFRRRSRVPLKLFRSSEHDLLLVEPDLERKHDATGKKGPETLQKF